jgi:hypothetical protein
MNGDLLLTLCLAPFVLITLAVIAVLIGNGRKIE